MVLKCTSAFVPVAAAGAPVEVHHAPSLSLPLVGLLLSSVIATKFWEEDLPHTAVQRSLLKQNSLLGPKLATQELGKKQYGEK